MRVLLFIAVLPLLTCCLQKKIGHVRSTEPLTPEEQHIVEIARHAVATNDTWVAQAEFEKPRPEAYGRWSVLVWRLPETPGGFRLITIDSDGRVTGYKRGY